MKDSLLTCRLPALLQVKAKLFGLWPIKQSSPSDDNNRSMGKKSAAAPNSDGIKTVEDAVAATNGDWLFAVADEVEDGGGGVAVLHGGAIEILAKSAAAGNGGGGYVSVCKVPAVLEDISCKGQI